MAPTVRSVLPMACAIHTLVLFCKAGRACLISSWSSTFSTACFCRVVCRKEMFPYLHGNKSEEINQVLVLADETLAQGLVLGGDTGGTGVQMTLAHHYATEHHQSGGGETVLFGTHQGHFYHIQTGFQLTVGLYFNTAP